jgi:hypothetical protein
MTILKRLVAGQLLATGWPVCASQASPEVN